MASAMAGSFPASDTICVWVLAMKPSHSELLSPRQSLLLSRSGYQLAMAGIGERLRQARVAAGYPTAAAAAAAFGWHPQNVRDHEAERRGVDAEQAATYGHCYRVDPAWIMFGGPTKRPRLTGLVPVIGKVGADPEGRILFAAGQAAGDQAPIPPGGTERAAALEVVGHSMRGVADDGSLIYFEEQHAQPTSLHIGKVVVVELDSGEVLVKRLLKGDERGVWDLESIAGPTRHNVRIKWVANISAIIPPPVSQRVIVRAAA